MKTSIISFLKKSFITTIVTAVSAFVLPSGLLMFWLIVAVTIDLFTGIAKARNSGEGVVSKKLRNGTGRKLLQYGGIIAVWIIIVNATKNDITSSDLVVTFVREWLIIFLIYVEVISICENIYEIDRKSKISRLIIKPLYSLLTLQIKNTFSNLNQQTKHNETEAIIPYQPHSDAGRIDGVPDSHITCSDLPDCTSEQ